MRALKILVIVMGVMLVVGVVVLIAAIAARVPRSGSVASAGQPFTAPPIELPSGAHIETMAVGPDRLVIDIVLADGTKQLLVIDLASGRRLGTIPLRTTP